MASPEERAQVVEALKEELASGIDRRVENLNALEQDFGFDPDVATDIYETKHLLSGTSRGLIRKWQGLLGAINTNPGRPLVLMNSIPRRTAQEFYDPMEFLGCSAVELSDIKYDKGKSDPSDSTIQVERGAYQLTIDSEGARTSQVSGIILADYSGRGLGIFGSRHPIGSMAAYNPTARQLINFYNDYGVGMEINTADEIRSFAETLALPGEEPDGPAWAG